MGKVTLSLIMLLMLAGCGPPRFFTVEEMDEQALRSATAFHSKPVQWDFQRPANWEISDKDWQEMYEDSNAAYQRVLVTKVNRKVYELAPGAGASSGAVIDLRIHRIARGHYSFFTWGPATLDAKLTITDVSSGKVLFRGSGVGRTQIQNAETAGDGGRLKYAHTHLADEIEALLEYYSGKK
ncbi:hypothetical protein EDM80_05175 [bacterium]|nr:MAG: hypothetical protein EDM80_05175 [bacterium]RIK61756.1 MAG: hypothetical protein DCC64_12590 [Planctomycetota bacterium]